MHTLLFYRLLLILQICCSWNLDLEPQPKSEAADQPLFAAFLKVRTMMLLVLVLVLLLLLLLVLLVVLLLVLLLVLLVLKLFFIFMIKISFFILVPPMIEDFQ